MSDVIAGFICAIVLSLLVVAWIVYCMFFRERHKSESAQYGISDLQHRNYQIAQEKEQDNKSGEKKKDISVGVFILPSPHRQKDDDFVKRPDYPEGPAANLQPGIDRMIDVFNESAVDADVHNKDLIFDSDTSCRSAYHSDV